MACQNTLYNACHVVEKDALNAIRKYEKLLSEKSAFGWTQAKHEAHYLKLIAEARATAQYCFIRQMQINPD